MAQGDSERRAMMKNVLDAGFRVVLLSLALVACGRGDAGAQPEKKGADTGPIHYVPGGNAEMNAAIQRARATVGELLERLRQPPPGLSYLGVKVRLGNGDVGEHIWLYGVRLDGEQIVGRLMDDAERFPRYRRGNEVRVRPTEISDWMTVENGRACGGFTVRAMMPQMSAEERGDYLREMEIPRLPPGDQVCDGEAGR